MGRDDAESGLVQLSAFCTPIGWIGLVGLRQTLVLVSIGHKTKDGLMKRVAERLSQQTGARPGAVADWNPELRDRIERYCEGEIVDFSDVTIPLSDHTLFAQAVLRAVRGVRYGQTRTYGQIATKVAAPRAARAVGRVLAANRFPLIVPCHRVVAATGRLGGFSAPRGIELKRQLLQMTEEAGLKSTVTCVGWPESDEVRNLLGKAWAALWPSDDNLINRAKCSAKLAELASLGIPTVAENVGENRLYVPSELLVESGDVEGFVKRAVELVQNKAFRRKMSRKAREKVVPHLLWANLVEAVVEFYHAVGKWGAGPRSSLSKQGDER